MVIQATDIFGWIPIRATGPGDFLVASTHDTRHSLLGVRVTRLIHVDMNIIVKCIFPKLELRLDLGVTNQLLFPPAQIPEPFDELEFVGVDLADD
jgi:hypothetical protein